MNGLAMPPEAVQQQARTEARKVFRAQFALQVLDSEAVRDYAATSKDGSSKADACRKRAAEILLAYLNEE